MQHNDTRFLELLRRWQSGEFTRSDEQELNALAASDEFRREAMEGFMSLPEATHNERLAALRTRLRDRSGAKAGGKRLIAMPQILAAAAALVLLIAAILFFPKWNQQDAAPVAQTQTQPAEQNPATESAAPAEAPESEYIADNSAVAKSAPSVSGPAKPAAGEKLLSAPGEVAATEETEAVSDDLQSGYAVAPPPVAAPLRTQPQSEATDKAALEAKKDYAATTGAQENAKTKKSKERAKQADSSWHETDRKPDMDAERKAARDEAQLKESEPEGGWEAFSEYLRLNARLTPEARNHNTSGTVQLQFNLNDNGDPQGFVVLRSVGYGCDQEAIRLVKNWEWVRGQNPIVIVEVPFVR